MTDADRNIMISQTCEGFFAQALVLIRHNPITKGKYKSANADTTVNTSTMLLLICIFQERLFPFPLKMEMNEHIIKTQNNNYYHLNNKKN